MKRLWPAVILAMAWGSAAAMAELTDVEITDRSDISDPASAIETAEGQWLGFSVPALPGTRSLCCWQSGWGDKARPAGQVGCQLEASRQSYGTRSDSPLMSSLMVYSKIEDGVVSNMQVVGDQCPVDGDGAQLVWIGEVDDQAGMEWLEQVARGDKNDRGEESALVALALHRNPGAGSRLYALAGEARGNLSEQAIFWLGQARGSDGYKYLEKLLQDLPHGELRRQINFALAENDNEQAAALLLETAQTDADPEQRGEAMFWLAQAYPQMANEWLKELVYTEQNTNVLEQAIFAISQLPDDDGSRVLLELARNSDIDREVRRQALFWLAQSDDDKTIAALTDLLTR